ncbi:MAG: sigma-70 family RNA polymerase sigma factor, partial [Acidobacteriota bacterium]|nr:sigma-70 family RNA polymerase sigma factor [Acidobacteriota bacterium]
ASKLHSRLPRNCGVDMADLVQAGNVGLLQAARSFEPSKGTPLAGYAKFRIRGEMLDAVRKNAENTKHFPAPAGDVESREGVDEHPNPAGDRSPQAALLRRERNSLIHAELNRLPRKYRTVIRLRYLEGLTHREIGEALKVNESRACQIHHEALTRLKRGLRSRGLNDFSHL